MAVDWDDTIEYPRRPLKAVNVSATISRISSVIASLETYEGYFVHLGIATLMAEVMPKSIKIEIMFHDSDQDAITISVVQIDGRAQRLAQTVLALDRYLRPELEKDNKDYE